jgi:hypothetical protein
MFFTGSFSIVTVPVSSANSRLFSASLLFITAANEWDGLVLSNQLAYPYQQTASTSKHSWVDFAISFAAVLSVIQLLCTIHKNALGIIQLLVFMMYRLVGVDALLNRCHGKK